MAVMKCNHGVIIQLAICFSNPYHILTAEEENYSIFVEFYEQYKLYQSQTLLTYYIKVCILCLIEVFVFMYYYLCINYELY